MWKYLIPAILIATSASGQSDANCGNREQVERRLAEGYGESRQMIGLGAHNRVVEVYASLETGTWTIVVTMPNGMACLVASGQAFELTPMAEPTGVPL